MLITDKASLVACSCQNRRTAEIPRISVNLDWFGAKIMGQRMQEKTESQRCRPNQTPMLTGPLRAPNITSPLSRKTFAQSLIMLQDACSLQATSR
jgi:hypothetical protein